jgi:hypothetical protein
VIVEQSSGHFNRQAGKDIGSYYLYFLKEEAGGGGAEKSRLETVMVRVSVFKNC